MKTEYRPEESGVVTVIARSGKAMLFALLFTVIVLLASSLLLTATAVSEKCIPAIVLVTMAVSVVIAGYSAAKHTGSRGFLRGAGIGLLYVVVLYCIAALITGNFAFNTYLLIMLAIGVFAGAFGGILGVNAGSKKRR